MIVVTSGPTVPLAARGVDGIRITNDGPSIAPTERGTVFLPIVMRPPPPPEPEPEVTPAWAPFGSALAYEFYQLLVTDARQQRSTLIVCPALIKAAEWRAQGLRDGGPWAHHDAAGKWANAYAKEAGCNHPYGLDSNQLESLVAGSPNMGAMLNALANSSHHADHIYGRNEFFRRQNRIGVGMAFGEDSLWKWYLCVMIADCGENSGE